MCSDNEEDPRQPSEVHPLVQAQRFMEAWDRGKGPFEPDLAFVSHIHDADWVTFVGNYIVEHLQEALGCEVPHAMRNFLTT